MHHRLLVQSIEKTASICMCTGISKYRFLYIYVYFTDSQVNLAVVFLECGIFLFSLY